MTRKTAFLTGVAALMLTSAPALAQETMPQQQTPPQASPTQQAQPATLELTPGASVKGSDGVELGKLEGVQNGASGQQELTVRGADGQLRGVPLTGIAQQGADISVGWSSAEYNAAPAIGGDDASAPVEDAMTEDSMNDEPADDSMAPPATDDAMTPPPVEPAAMPRTPPTTAPDPDDAMDDPTNGEIPAPVEPVSPK